MFKLLVRGTSVASTSVGEIGETAEQVRDERAGVEDDNGTVDRRVWSGVSHGAAHNRHNEQFKTLQITKYLFQRDSYNNNGNQLSNLTFLIKYNNVGVQIVRVPFEI